MSGGIGLRTRSRARLRWAGRLPRLLAAGFVVVLCAAGLRAALAGPAEPPAPVARLGSGDLPARGFAESFARAYLTWDAARPERHDRQLAGFLPEALDPGAGFTPPGRGAQRVLWTAAVQDVALGAVRRLITVAAQTTSGLVYLAVPVARDGRGFLYVYAYPALVGGPPTARRAQPPEEDEVADEQLRAVVARALRNYLGREGQNLRADLDPRAVVSLPPERLRLRSLDALTRSGPGRVAAVVEAADPQGASLTLRYELQVVRRDRWYVRAIASNPIERGSS